MLCFGARSAVSGSEFRRNYNSRDCYILTINNCAENKTHARLLRTVVRGCKTADRFCSTDALMVRERELARSENGVHCSPLCHDMTQPLFGMQIHPLMTAALFL